ncbi:hypothetical protein ACHAWF_001595 [Thalassiosira exigua]
MSDAADLIMEKSVQHNRKKTGKVEQMGMDKKMEHAAEEIPNQPAQYLVMKDLRTKSEEDLRKSGSKTHDWLRNKSPIIKGFDLIHNSIQLWHPTEQPIIDGTPDNSVRAKANEYNLPGKETLNPEILQFPTIGTKRAIKYGQVNYIDNPFKVDRSEAEVPLTRILATSLDRKAELKKQIDKVTSVSAEDLDDALNRDETGEQLLYVIDQLNFHMNPPIRTLIPSLSLSKMNKADRIVKLIELRQLYFTKDKEAKSKHEQRARSDFELKYPTISTSGGMNALLSEDIYSLSDEVLCLDRYKT